MLWVVIFCGGVRDVPNVSLPCWQQLWQHCPRRLGAEGLLALSVWLWYTALSLRSNAKEMW